MTNTALRAENSNSRIITFTGKEYEPVIVLSRVNTLSLLM